MSEHDHSSHECAHCAALASGMTEAEALIHGLQETKRMIEEMGIAVLGVGSDGVSIPYLYTIGFTNLGLPEVIIMASVDPRMFTHFLNTYHAELLAGSKKPGACVINDYINIPIGVIECDDRVNEYTVQCAAYYEIVEEDKLKPKFVQWVLADRNGKLPWEGDFTSHFGQLLLGDAPK
ncbi:hypothetical protein S21ZY_127 [Pseudomonas phage ZY21]|nr:hypothetical protein S21ZY_127 [Pseudomonas phage ZY21]